MKFVALLSCTVLFLFAIVPASTQDSNTFKGYRAGRYEGQALNTTANQRGKVVLELFDLDQSSGRLRAYFAASEGLEGEAWLSGRINSDGELYLSGSLSQFAMEVRGKLTPTGGITAAYSLKAATSQNGNFEVSFARALPETTPGGSQVDNLIGAWEIGGGMPAPTNPVTGMTAGMSFVDVRRLEILPGGEFSHLHSHEHCQVTGAARCCLQTATMERGTIDINGSQMTLHINGGDDLARDNCNPRLNQQRHLASRTVSFAWSLRRGNNGTPQLCLQGGDANETTCYQKQS